MNRTEFLKILNNPDLLSEETLTQLQEIVNEYPFFQAAKMLLVKNLHKLDHIKYNSELKHSAVYIADRSKLFFLVNGIDRKKQATKKIEKIQYDFASAKNEDVGALTAKETSVKEEKESTKQSTAIDNYLQAEDKLVDKEGEVFQFPRKKKEPEDKVEKELDDIVLPSADLLDYENVTSEAAYVLPELEEDNEVSLGDNRSFSDWLHVMRYSPTQQPKEKEKVKPPKGIDLINNFLSTQPKIIPSVTHKRQNVDLSQEREKSEEDILSETLASIYIKQGHKSKAILIFEKLRLKYPEKNAYFARRIRDLKEN